MRINMFVADSRKIQFVLAIALIVGLLFNCSIPGNSSNNAPFLGSSTVIYGLTGDKLVNQINAVDPDGDSVMVLLQSAPGWLTVHNGYLTGTAPKAGQFTAQIVLLDGHNAPVVSHINILITPADEFLAGVMEGIQLDSLTAYVQLLTGRNIYHYDSYTGYIQSRHQRSYGNILTAGWIEGRLRKYGLLTSRHEFSPTGTNIFAYQPGSTYRDSIFIICAHYDSWYLGRISPGADDNASGVAALIETARILSKYNTKYSIVYAFWDETVNAAAGSQAFARRVKDCGELVVGVINLDMLAWDREGDGRFNIRHFNTPQSQHLADIAEQTSAVYFPDLVPIRTEIEYYVDESSFHPDYPTIGISEDINGDMNPFYKTIDDQLDNFNSQYFLSLSQLSTGSIALLSKIQPGPILESAERQTKSSGCLTTAF